MTFRVRARYKLANTFVHAYHLRRTVPPDVLRIYVDPDTGKPYVEVKRSGDYEMWLMRAGRRPCIVTWGGNRRMSLAAGDQVRIDYREAA